jgi:hypothetical protein
MNRPNKIDALYDGRRHVQSRRNVREDGRSSTQSDIGELSKTRQSLNDQKFGRRLSEAAHSTPVLSSKRTQMWSSIVFSNGDNFVGYSDVDGSVAAMKAHLEKYIITKDPNTCIRCEWIKDLL